MDARKVIPKPQHISWNRKLKHPLKFYENLQKVLDARATKTASVLHRKQILDHMTNNNYRLEMERLRGMLESRAIRGDNARMLRDRIHRLQELGAKAIDQIQ
jgi:hypothetical protein